MMMEGSFGTVLVGRGRVTKYNKDEDDFSNEINLLCEIGSHPNVVQVLSFSQPDSSIDLELATKGDLRDVLNDQGSLSVRETCRIMRQVASALEFIHSREVVHLDVKLDNILCFERGVVKLADFGLGQKGRFRDGHIEIYLDHDRGTDRYIPPEIDDMKRGQRKWFTRAETLDVYSFTVTCFVLLTNEYFPFEHVLDYKAFTCQGPKAWKRRIQNEFPRLDHRVLDALLLGLATDPFQRVSRPSIVIDSLQPVSRFTWASSSSVMFDSVSVPELSSASPISMCCS
jgi:serine/threonine protein kinase